MSAANREQACERCGETFQPTHGNRPQRFCSRTCAHPKRTTQYRQCERCGSVLTTHRQLRFCSNRCARTSLLSEAERFWPKVNKGGPTSECRPDLGPCWIWTAYVDRQTGYARFSRKWAHRWCYIHVVGPIPRGLELDHLCRTLACVNPLHLEPVSHRVNVLRGEGFAAVHAKKTRCVHGHFFDAANTIHDKRGHRKCRTCKQATDRERKATRR